MAGGPWQSAAAAVIEIGNACDVSIVAPGKGVPGDPKVIEAASGDTVILMADSLCDPMIGDVFDKKLGKTVLGLVSGDGISIAAPGIILDFNGHAITSTKDILAEAAEQGLDVENAGVSVGEANVKVTNSSLTTVAVVSNFTAEFDLGKGSQGSMLLGMSIDDDSDPATHPVRNIEGRDDHGGGVLAIDRTQNLMIYSVKLSSDDLGGNGTVGVDMKRCSGPLIYIMDSELEGALGGVRIRDCTAGSYMLMENEIHGFTGDGVLFARDVKGVAVVENTIEDNAFNGVTVGIKSENISIQLNTIQNNLGCGIQVSKDPSIKNITTAPNTFLNNAGGDVCVK
jgi:hypothetical protein